LLNVEIETNRSVSFCDDRTIGCVDSSCLEIEFRSVEYIET